MGLDSATSAYFIVELEEWVGVELEPELVFDYPTVGELARHIVARQSAGNGGRSDMTSGRPRAAATLRRTAASPRRGAAGRPGLYRAVGSRAGSWRGSPSPNLARRSADLARHIAARAEPGDRALLVCPNGIGFMVGFFACVLSRVAAVPMMVPRRDSARDASAGILADCTPRLVLAPRALIDGKRGDLAARFATARPRRGRHRISRGGR